MAYRVPEFNITCNIYTGPFPVIGDPPGKAPRLSGQVCQLTYGRRVNFGGSATAGGGGTTTAAMSLLLPKRTDIRGPQDSSTISDFVEVPAGSRRWYGVFFVDEVGRGFANEYRIAGILAVAGT